MRIPYASSTPPTDASQETQDIYNRIAERRKPRPLIPLDLALLHNPQIADGYNTLLGAIRTKSSFPLHVAELAICYIAVLNTAVYEWKAHAPIALKAGASRPALQAVLDKDVKNEEVLSEEEREVLEFTYQSTKEIKVAEDVMSKLKKRWNDKQVMELTITVAGYNMVSRFLVALDVTESNGEDMVMPKED
ncbi:uncharacterized protein MYCFIDRAFT_63438 [Pseudocercospora fijiensis CIRAD86]|uniref:Carboxymuconolactone decarboxylase-like domain-containing protein n=1 Tax=Pseudocercospora fijiensis (strain CIRAD86) TaxID=383855 RepID=M3ARZ4_PSEFD|nr:uncharacterized protein MYCFIDRAFT_63438 [Pseudocercospora fijiensis CIRAD86]EME80227.1 hypothetical protein MYCFIDRAFT_63438 [Pseudocercospora fijiensis CIRAD86]